MGRRWNWKLLLLEGGASRGLEKPFARHCRVPHPEAERLGLTYEEYTLEILERGRHLQIEDVERIAEIKRRRADHAVVDRKNTERYFIRPEPFMPDIQIKILEILA